MSDDELHRGEGRFFFALIGLVGLFFLLVQSSYSPLALNTARFIHLSDSPQEAVVFYDRVAQNNPVSSVRDEALYQSALIWAEELQGKRQSLSRLRQLLVRTPEGAFSASAWEQIGVLLAQNEANLRESAQAYCLAYQMRPDALKAVDRLINCALRFSEAGANKLSDREWRRIYTAFPKERARSLLGRANLRLAENKAEAALGLFETALDQAKRPEERLVASLGVSSCLERLGDVDEALAELDLAELPFDVVEHRRRGLRARQMEGDFWAVERRSRLH